MSSTRIFNLADNEFQFWKPFSYLGTEINFDHLKARKYTYSRPERNEHYTLFITISHHVFTVDAKKSKDPEGPQIYPHKPQDERAFCPTRYALSFVVSYSRNAT